MNNRERENATLSFEKPGDRGAVEETFYPWDLTIERWKSEGMPGEIADNLYNAGGRKIEEEEKYLDCVMTEGVGRFESYLSFDAVQRVHFALPFRRFEQKIIEETAEYTIRQETDGRQRKYYKIGNWWKTISL